MPLMRSAILSVMPKRWRAALEAESRRWQTLCPNCQHQSTIWDLGGLRYKARDDGRLGIWCPKCGKLGQHQVKLV